MINLYGNTECKYNEHTANPAYLIKCVHPKIDDIMKGSDCKQCPIFSLEFVVTEDLIDMLSDNQLQQVRQYILRLLKGDDQDCLESDRKN